MIRVYCVGIHFRHNVDFQPDLQNGPTHFMSGAKILAACESKWKLRYKLSSAPPSAVGGHIDYVGYTPDPNTDNNAVDPGSAPRVTFAVFGAKVFPFFGQPLSLTEILSPIGQPSQVLQYTVHSLDTSKPAPPVYIPNPATTGFIAPANDGKSSFGGIGIQDNSEVRIRSLNIYCTY